MKRILVILITLISSCNVFAQTPAKETAVWAYFSLSKSFNSRWSGGMQTELRTGDDNSRMYLWYIDANARYRVNSWFAVSGGFDYIKIHTRRTSTRPSMWRTDWRPYIAIIPSVKIGNMKVSLNESLTYNWFPETKEDGVVARGMAYYLVRHRISFEYPITGTCYTPYARYEVRQTKKLERARGTIGTYIKLTPTTTIDINYVYQDMHNSTKTHALGLGYRIRL